MPEVIDHCIKIMDESVFNDRPDILLKPAEDIPPFLLKGLISKKKMLERFSWLPLGLSESGKEMFHGDLFSTAAFVPYSVTCLWLSELPFRSMSYPLGMC
jgi:hypothetical protein